MVEHLEIVNGAGSLLVRAVRLRPCEQGESANSSKADR